MMSREEAHTKLKVVKETANFFKLVENNIDKIFPDFTNYRKNGKKIPQLFYLTKELEGVKRIIIDIEGFDEEDV